MTKARDWMLFIPFLANYLVKTINTVETILTEKSMYKSHNESPSLWEKAVLLLTNSCLDFIELIHTKTVAQEPADFPVSLYFLQAHSIFTCKKKKTNHS